MCSLHDDSEPTWIDRLFLSWWYSAFLTAALIVALAIAVWAWWSAPASAHDWFSDYRDPRPGGVNCCDGDDCKALDFSDIEWRPDGVYIRSLDELVPLSEIQKSEDFQYWRCHKSDGTRRCFFAPSTS
jgi:hypothetical protein